MSRVLKIGLGTVFLVCAAFYSLVVIAIMLGAKQDAVNAVDPYLEFTYEGCEKVNGEAKIGGEVWHTPDGNDLYCFSFTVRNRSSEEYYANPGEALIWNGCYSIVPDNSYYEKLFYGASTAMLPGKAEAKVQIYAEVEKQTESVTASYYPNWEEDEVRMEIPLRVE